MGHPPSYHSPRNYRSGILSSTSLRRSKEGKEVWATRPTTVEQRAAVQGKPCVDCGQVGDKMVANHKTPLVKEYYKTGKIDTARMRSPNSVNSQCPTCSAKQGGRMAQYSKEMKEKIKSND